jgi:hypothetical protein
LKLIEMSNQPQASEELTLSTTKDACIGNCSEKVKGLESEVDRL